MHYLKPQTIQYVFLPIHLQEMEFPAIQFTVQLVKMVSFILKSQKKKLKLNNSNRIVPDAPANVKAAAITADSILVSWLTPIHRNGLILHYTVYCREIGRKGQPKSYKVNVDELGIPVNFEARGLNENKKYEFWVSAATASGEGEPTVIVSQMTNTRAPARIASFSQIVKKAVGKGLILECVAVGNPTPRARWFTRDRPVTFSPFYEVTSSGNLKIHSVEPNLSGNYTCSAKNLFGEDEITYTVVAMKTPNPPQIIIQYASADSIRISWDSPDDGGASVEGYILQYRTTGNAWNRIEITPELTAYTINGLKCGTQFIVRLSAQNKIGEGHQSDEIIVWTKGKIPQPPNENELISTNATCLKLQLSAWGSGGCTISHFSIEHRPIGELRWTVVSSHTSAGTTDEDNENLMFCEFLPAAWYQLRISAINDAGKATIQYNFATTTIDGSRFFF